MAKKPEEKDTTKKVKAPKKETKKVAKKSTKKNTPKAPKESFLKGVKKEMSLVKWPTWKEVLKNTISTLVLCIIVCGFFILLNLLLSVIKGMF